MKHTLLLLAPGTLTVLTGLAAWRTADPLWIDTYKLCLSFTLVGVLGVAIKSAVDAKIDAEKESRRRYEEAEKERNRRYDEWEKMRGGLLRSLLTSSLSFIVSENYTTRQKAKDATCTRIRLLNTQNCFSAAFKSPRISKDDTVL
jgi:hypothetical protein